MHARAGATTITEVPSSPQAGGSAEVFLTWLFPRPGGEPVSLSGPGDGEFLIGRDADCAIHLTGKDVSRRHAVIARRGADRALVIRDLRSRNGVRVNGQEITASPLGAGDIVRLGGWVGVLTATPGAFGEIAPGLVGGVALRNAVAPLVRAAASELSIVIEGETGTGKEVVSRAVHSWSGRGGPLIAVNCAALPEALAEGELFGYRRGAFTGADRASPGFFRSAEGGTLLLDEVSDLPLSLQAKLLRVLEERQVQPLGETRPVPIDVRIIVAGQRSLMESARTGGFRADLLARLDGLTVRLPPLRHRREDIAPLFFHLLRKLGRGPVPAVESDLVERLCVHDWPFNVRELVQLVRRLLVLRDEEPTLSARHLPERIGALAGGPPAFAAIAPIRARVATLPGPTVPTDLPALAAALRVSGGNVAQAAAMLGISRQRAYRWMEGQSIDLEALRGTNAGRR
jgi:DNA-binding NtrC family response regulator